MSRTPRKEGRAGRRRGGSFGRGTADTGVPRMQPPFKPRANSALTVFAYVLGDLMSSLVSRSDIKISRSRTDGRGPGGSARVSADRAIGLPANFGAKSPGIDNFCKLRSTTPGTKLSWFLGADRTTPRLPRLTSDRFSLTLITRRDFDVIS